MSETFTITYRYPDLLAGKWFALRKRWIWQGALKSGGSLACAFIAADLILDGSQNLLDTILMGLVLGAAWLGGVFLFFLWNVPHSVRKGLELGGASHQQVHYEFDAEGLSILDTTKRIDLEWSGLLKWAENDQFLLLYRTNDISHCVPKHQIEAATLAALKARLVAAAVRKF